MLVLSPFENALASLNEALAAYDQTPSQLVRDACIQRFEYTYELAFRMLKRQMEAISANPSGIDRMSFQDLVHSGAEQGLLANGWDKWRLYRDARNVTSHAYSEEKAVEVFARIPDFRDEARALLDRLKMRNP